MRGTLLFLLVLPCFCFSQNDTVKVKKECAVCGSWDHIYNDDAHKGDVIEKRIVFYADGSGEWYESPEGKPYRLKWKLQPGSLQLVFDNEEGQITQHKVYTMKTSVRGDSLYLDVPEKGMMLFHRKK
jgi:hypothetical protein